MTAHPRNRVPAQETRDSKKGNNEKRCLKNGSLVDRSFQGRLVIGDLLKKIKSKKKIMIHTNTKFWSFTWGTNKKQKKLPTEDQLLSFFGRVADDCVFQYEKGSKMKKIHIQGTFTLNGPRQSKTRVLGLFDKTFRNIGGLTLSPVYDSLAIRAYVTKSEGRVKGPFYGGKKEMYDERFASSKLRKWQKELFEIITGDHKDYLKDRKVIWVQDPEGNTGKSWFQKWLVIGQKKLLVRPLPVSSVDRLFSAIFILNKTHKVDAYTINLTRTMGDEQSYNDLFGAIEQIKDGMVVDSMFGKYNLTIFDPPMVLIFSNKKFKDFCDYESGDRWEVFTISPDGDLAKTYSPYEHVLVKDLKKQKNIFPGEEDSRDL